MKSIKKNILFLLFLSILVNLVGTKVLLIEDSPYCNQDNPDNFIKFYITEIFKKLDITPDFEYVSHDEVMNRIDKNDFFITTPFYIPKRLSNRILVSEKLYTFKNHVFYNELIYNHLDINSLTDLKTYIIGSNAFYKHEQALRKAGLTIHYSRNNIESIQKLTEQKVSFVIEEKIKGLMYLNQSTGKFKENIKFYDISFFHEDIFIGAAINNNESVRLMEKINTVLLDSALMNQIEENFINQILVK